MITSFLFWIFRLKIFNLINVILNLYILKKIRYKLKQKKKKTEP
jgi:hypothetical protein